MRSGQDHRTPVSVPRRARHEWIDNRPFNEPPFAVKDLDADSGKDVEREPIGRHEIRNWPVNPELEFDVVPIQLWLADHMRVVEIREEALCFKGESYVCISILD